MEVFQGKIWISGQGLTEACVGVEGGKIHSVKKILKGSKLTKISGLLIPSALDMHVHFRDPGYPDKEDWSTGSKAADSQAPSTGGSCLDAASVVPSS